jgi:uncharacterized protein involved in exopolysaccharide biosynthesis
MIIAEQKSKKLLSDYINILFKWKRLIFIITFLILILATVYSFIIPEKFKSTATVMVPQENSFGLSGISSLVSDGAAGLGAKLFGMKSSSEDLIFGILNSRNVLQNVVEKFDLAEYYSVTDGNIDKVLKSFRGDLIFELNEHGLIEISVINESPELSAELVNYFIKLSDSINVSLSIQQAKNNRLYIESRYFKNVNDLRLAEDSLYSIQKKYGVFVVPEQLEVTIKAAAEIESQLYQKELELDLISGQVGKTSPQYLFLEEQVKLLRNRIAELKNSSTLSESSNVFFPFKNIPEISLAYLRTFREVEIQSKILQLILPMYEQAKVEETKNIPTLMVVDKAVPPQLKHSPKKAFIIILALFLTMAILLPLVFRMENITGKALRQNLIEEKEFKIYSRIKNFFRIK